jgi:hypothetical protein
VNGRDVQALVARLVAAYPRSITSKSAEEFDLIRGFLARLEHGIAEEALWDVIATKSSWPSIPEIAAAYDARIAEQRRQATERQELLDRLADIEPTDDERRRMLAQARGYAERKWGTP